MKGCRLKVEIAQRSLSDRHALHAAYEAYLAERVGFEPTVASWATKVFEAPPIFHSGTSPMGSRANALGRGHYSNQP
jgi:hypothetical protein